MNTILDSEAVLPADILTLWVDHEAEYLGFPDIVDRVQQTLFDNFNREGTAFLHTSIKVIRASMQVSEEEVRRSIDALMEFGTFVQISVTKRGGIFSVILKDPNDENVRLAPIEVELARKSVYGGPKPIENEEVES